MDKAKPLSRNVSIILAVLLIAVAVAPRLWCFGRDKLPEGDAGNYLELGANLAKGRGFVTYAKWDFYGDFANLGPVVHAEGNRQPLLPLVVAATFKLGAADHNAARVVTFFVSLAALAFLFLVIRRWFGDRLAYAATAVAALEPSFLWFSTRVQTEPYFALFLFAALWLAGDLSREKPAPVVALAVGILTGLAYLTRTNGFLLAAAYVLALLLVYRGRGLAAAALAVVGFAAVAAPWWVRNARVFGDPFYSQAKYFIIAPTFDAVWEFKRHVPTWSSFFASYSPLGLAARYGRGLWRAVEPFLLGNSHFNELYEGAPLAAFVALAFVAGPVLRPRRALVFPSLAALFTILAFAAYGQGLYRYFVPFYLLLIPLGLAGARRAREALLPARRFAAAAFFVVLLLPFVRPLGKTLVQNDEREYAAVKGASEWLAKNTRPDDVVVTWPRVIELLYQYDRPSLYWPVASNQELLAVLDHYNVKYVVVEPLTLALRPRLNTLWWMGPKGVAKANNSSDGGDLIVRVDYGADAFKQVYREEGSDIVVYEVDHEKLRRSIYGVYLTGAR